MKTTALPSWRQALGVYLQPEVRVMLALGFAAGLPYLLIFSTLSAWLEEAGVAVSAIGYFSWVGLAYSVKVAWAPVVDRVRLPWLGRWLGQRRSWIVLAQLGIAAGLGTMAGLEPGRALPLVAALAVWIAFASATQDVAIDAFRIELAPVAMQGALSAGYILGYRCALLVAGAGALYLAQFADWRTAYLCMAALMGVGLLTILLVAEPSGREAVSREGAGEGHWLRRAIVAPFTEFFRRQGWRMALLILALVGLYKISDIAIGILANPFYLQLGFSKAEIASIGKVYGFAMTIFGTFAGGALVVRYGVLRPLLLGAVLVAVTNLLFIQLALAGPRLDWLALVISADNFGGGLANAAFIAYLSSLTNRDYTATQYALFSSLMTLPGKLLSGFSGVIVAAWDYPLFFVYTTLLGLPAITLCCLLLYREHRGAGGASGVPAGH